MPVASALALTLILSAPPPGVTEGRRWSSLTATRFRHLTPESGLPNTIATALAEDGAGFIWVGTQGGLSRWDGYRFRNYEPRAGDPQALPSLFVHALHVDGQGRLWVGTTAGLARYDPEADGFVTISEALQDPTVQAMADDGAGGLYVATAAGLDRLDPATGKVTHEGTGGEGGLPAGRVSAVRVDRSGALFVGTGRGLFRREPGGSAFVPVPLAAGQAASVERLLEDAAGDLWIGTRRDGSYRRAKSGEVAPVVDSSLGEKGGPGDNVGSLVEAAPGLVFVGTFGHGILAVDAATGHTRRIRRDPTVAATLGDDSVWALIRDRSGLVWAGTNRGVSVHDPAQGPLQTVFSAARPGGVTDDEIFAVARASDGRVWLGLGTNGVDVLDPVHGRGAALRPDSARPEAALPKDRVWSIAPAPGGAVYIGTNRGLYKSDAEALSVARLTIPGRSLVESTQCLLLAERTLFLGGTAGGLWGLDLESGRGRRIGEEELANERIISLADARRPGDAGPVRFWLATATNLVHVDPEASRIARVGPGDEAARTMGLAGITTLLVDRSGRLWIGNDSGDLHVMPAGATPADPRLRRVDTGPTRRGIAKLLEDAEGRVWASTDGGLRVIDGASFAVRSFGSADGDAFPTGYWADSGAHTAPGEMVFGALGGLTVVHSEGRKEWNYRPPVVITDLRVGGVAVPAHRFTGASSDDHALELRPSGNHLAVEFSALDYSAPEQNRYAYRLEGVDPDWVPSDPTRRLATYANLAPGSYRLRLRGSNRNGEWAESERILSFRVLPAWHQTAWFRALLALLAAAGVYAIVAARTASLRRRQAELEERVRERTAQLEEASRALEKASLTDALTGLHNRRYLMQTMNGDALVAIRRYEGGGEAALPADADLLIYLLDLDHFKRINDAHGHAGGDAVLVAVPGRLRAILREGDSLVRWGGEEIMVVARGAGRAAAADQAERMRRAVADVPFALPGGVSLPVTCSIGFAAFPFVVSAPRAVSWTDVAELADLALYAAKRAGRNGWVGLGAGPGAVPAGLLPRLRTSPRDLVARAEIVIETSLERKAVLAGLA